MASLTEPMRAVDHRAVGRPALGRKAGEALVEATLATPAGRTGWRASFGGHRARAHPAFGSHGLSRCPPAGRPGAECHASTEKKGSMRLSEPQSARIDQTSAGPPDALQ